MNQEIIDEKEKLLKHQFALPCCYSVASNKLSEWTVVTVFDEVFRFLGPYDSAC